MDAVKCPKCYWVYWTHPRENWGTCPKCDSNNDHVPGAEIVSSDHIFTYYSELLEKAKRVIENDKRRS